jgi:hypothetical protein
MLLILSGLGKNTKVRWALQEAVLKLELTGTIDDCVLLIKMTQNIHGLYLCGSHTHVRGTSTTEILAWIAARSYVAVSEKHRHCPIIASNLLARPSPPDVRCHRAGVPFELAGGSTRRRWPLPQRGSMVQLHFNPGGHSLSDSASRWLHCQWKARIWYGLLAIFIYLSFAVLCAYMPFFVGELGRKQAFAAKAKMEAIDAETALKVAAATCGLKIDDVAFEFSVEDDDPQAQSGSRDGSPVCGTVTAIWPCC